MRLGFIRVALPLLLAMTVHLHAHAQQEHNGTKMHHKSEGAHTFHFVSDNCREISDGDRRGQGQL